MTPEELETRLILFGVACLKLVRQMPPSPDARHVAGQLMRSGTSPGFHYGEVRSAESPADFRHKLKVVHKELRESYNALRMIKYMEEDYAPNEVVKPILKEAGELVAIFTTTLRACLGLVPTENQGFTNLTSLRNTHLAR